MPKKKSTTEIDFRASPKLPDEIQVKGNVVVFRGGGAKLLMGGSLWGHLTTLAILYLFTSQNRLHPDNAG